MVGYAAGTTYYHWVLPFVCWYFHLGATIWVLYGGVRGWGSPASAHFDGVGGIVCPPRIVGNEKLRHAARARALSRLFLGALAPPRFTIVGARVVVD